MFPPVAPNAAKVSRFASHACVSAPIVNPKLLMAVLVEERSERSLSAAIKVEEANEGKVMNVVAETFALRSSV